MPGGDYNPVQLSFSSLLLVGEAMHTGRVCSSIGILASVFFGKRPLLFLVVAVSVVTVQAGAAVNDGQLAVYEGSFDLMDVYGIKANLHYSHGCLTGDADACQMMISVTGEVDERFQVQRVDDEPRCYLNYLSYLKSTGQSLQVRFETLVPAASDTSLSSYKVFYTTDNKAGRIIKNMDASVIPTRLQKNPLLLFAVLATHQSSLDLVLAPQDSLYTLLLPWLDLNTLQITNAGRGGYFGYRYYVFPKDNELFLDLGGPFSINSLSEGVGFSFADNDQTQPPTKMVTGYHGEQKNWFIHRISTSFAYLILASGVGAGLWNHSLAGLLVSALLLAVEARAGAASGELLVLATRTLPDGLQFNKHFQGRHLMAVLRSSDTQ